MKALAGLTLTRDGLTTYREPDYQDPWACRDDPSTRVACKDTLLARAGLVTPEPLSGPKSSYLRFEAAQANECWQVVIGVADGEPVSEHHGRDGVVRGE